MLVPKSLIGTFESRRFLGNCPLQKQNSLLIETPALLIRQFLKPLLEFVGNPFQCDRGHKE